MDSACGVGKLSIASCACQVAWESDRTGWYCNHQIQESNSVEKGKKWLGVTITPFGVSDVICEELLLIRRGLVFYVQPEGVNI